MGVTGLFLFAVTLWMMHKQFLPAPTLPLLMNACRGLQAALAAMCQQHSTEKAGLPSSPASQPHLLLARWTPAAGGGQLELLTEAGRKLAGLVPARPAVSLSSGSRAPQLLGYLYADVDSGPAAGKRAVLVHHRSVVWPGVVLQKDASGLVGIDEMRAECWTRGRETHRQMLPFPHTCTHSCLALLSSRRTRDAARVIPLVPHAG